MALYSIVAGNPGVILDVNQIINLLTGVMTDQVITLKRPSAGNTSIDMRLSADTQSRLSLTADGYLNFGPGNNATLDTNLYRAAANQLKTDDSLIVGATLYVGATDTGFSRASAGVVQTGNLINYVMAASSTVFNAAYVTGDTQSRFYIRADGYQAWGPGGSSTQDVFLSRASSGVLSITGALSLTGSITLANNTWLLAKNSSGTAYGALAMSADNFLQLKVPGAGSKVRIVNDAVSAELLTLDNNGNGGVLGNWTVGGIRSHRHPYAAQRHIVSDNATTGAFSANSATTLGFTFARAFSAAPNLGLSRFTPNAGAGHQCQIWVSALNGTGVTITAFNTNGDTTINSVTIYYVAEGAS